MKENYSLLFCLLAFAASISSCTGSRRIIGSKRNFIDSAAQQLINSKELETAHVGISIFDPSENKYLYNYDGDKYFIPASNTKIITCYAAMKYLGDSLEGLRVDDHFNTLLIYPTGDPTLLSPDFSSQPVIEFLKRENKQLLFVKTKWNEAAFGPGWAWDDYQDYYSAERSAFPVYGNVIQLYGNIRNLKIFPPLFDKDFALSKSDSSLFPAHIKRDLRENRFTIDQFDKQELDPVIPFITNDSLTLQILEDTIHRSFFKLPKEWTAVTPSDTIFVIHSQPTDSLLKIMMHRSDNFYAEQSLLMVSNEMLGTMNDEKIIDTLLNKDFKNIPQKPQWVDGSGLSRYNLFTPQDFVFVLNKMRNEFSWNRITTIFPTGGAGTLGRAYSSLEGKIYAKTGTLSNNASLSGYLITNKGKTLIFSVMVGNHMTSVSAIRDIVSKFLSAVADRY